MLKLEITESAYATLEAGAFSFLEEMHKLDLDVLLDDFGNGMSSLFTLEFLQSVDCDMIQGYYFYKPLPVEEFEKLI